MVFFARLLRAGCQDRRAPLVSVLGAGDVWDSSILLLGLNPAIYSIAVNIC
jgi:hypothetical protein